MAGIIDGRVTVTTAGTRVQLTPSTQCDHVIVQALPGNTNAVTVGASTVVGAAGTRRGLGLTANQAATLYVDDVADIWVDSVTNGEGVSFVAITE